MMDEVGDASGSGQRKGVGGVSGVGEERPGKVMSSSAVSRHCERGSEHHAIF